MNGKTHAGISALAYMTACGKLPCKFSYAGLFVVIFAALLPDIDHPKSIFNRYLFFIRSKGGMVALYTCLSILTLCIDYIYFNIPVLKLLSASFFAVAISSHRNGLTHSLTGLIVFTSIASYTADLYNLKYLSFWFMFGYGSHLLCDMATNRGVPLFYPFKNKKYKFPLTYRMGSKVGNNIEKVILIMGLIYVVYRLPWILNFQIK